LGFKQTTSSNKCSLTLTSIPGTGYVASDGSQYAASISSSNSGVSLSLPDQKVNYSATSDTYSKSISFSYSQNSGKICYGKTTGTQDTGVLATVTDVVSGRQVTIYVTVTC